MRRAVCAAVHNIFRSRKWLKHDRRPWTCTSVHVCTWRRCYPVTGAVCVGDHVYATRACVSSAVPRDRGNRARFPRSKSRRITRVCIVMCAVGMYFECITTNGTKWEERKTPSTALLRPLLHCRRVTTSDFHRGLRGHETCTRVGFCTRAVNTSRRQRSSRQRVVCFVFFRDSHLLFDARKHIHAKRPPILPLLQPLQTRSWPGGLAFVLTYRRKQGEG